MMKSFKIGLIAGVSALLSTAAGFAATPVTGELEVRLEIIAACALEATEPVDFGQWTAITEAIPGEGAVSVRCAQDLPYTVGLGGGQSGNILSRHMVNGDSSITYQLYQDEGRSNLWGEEEGQVHNGIGTGEEQKLPVYGQVEGPQDTIVGLYQDIVTVTLNY